uniref:NPYR-13 n=1 Tax=Schmidtea mediterranea TaxID=79327 RepID=A0A193KUR5_SCHMD|nr:NPYR-13 [Schmidtea mediterranea]
MEFNHAQQGSHRKFEFVYSISTLFSILTFLGIALNLLIVLVILKHCVFHNVTNIFVLTLAISDILLCAFNIPIQTYYEITEKAGFGTITCKVVFALFSVPLYISSLTILLIAVDRYRIIIYPLKERISKSTATILVILIVVISTMSSIPVALFTHSIYTENNSLSIELETSYCAEYWPYLLPRLCYSCFVFLFHYFLPLIITAYLYISIYYRLKMRTFKKRDNVRKLRTNKILIAIVLCFAVFWSPWTIYSLYLESYSYYSKMRWLQGYVHHIYNFNSSNLNETSFFNPKNVHTKTIDQILKCFATFSCVINPFLYGWLNDSIKEVLCRNFTRFRHLLIENLSGHNSQRGDNKNYRFNRLDMKNNNFQEGSEKANLLLTNQNKWDAQHLNAGAIPSIFDMSTKRTSLYPSNNQRNPSHMSQDASNVNYESSFISNVPHNYTSSERRFTNESSDITLSNAKEIDVFTAMAIVVKQQTFDRSRRVSLAVESKRKPMTLLNRKTSLM